MSYKVLNFYFTYILSKAGADPGFPVGGALKKIVPSGGRCENFWGISCEKSRFYSKKSYFFPILGDPPPPGSAPAKALSRDEKSKYH